jgi:hypothetical protein
VASRRGGRRAYRDVRHLLIVVSSWRRFLSTGTDDQQPGGRLLSQVPQPNESNTTATGCSFEMIRASFQQDWASRGCFRYTWTTRHPKPECTEQGRLISVRSGLNAKAAAVTHQSSRPACRLVPTRAGPSTTLTALNLITLTTTGHRRHGTVCPSTAGAQARNQPAILLLAG